MGDCGLLDFGATCTSPTPYISVLIIALGVMLLLHFVLRGFEFFVDMSRRIALLDVPESEAGVLDRLHGAPERAVRGARKVGTNKKKIITSRK